MPTPASIPRAAEAVAPFVLRREPDRDDASRFSRKVCDVQDSPALATSRFLRIPCHVVVVPQQKPMKLGVT